MINKDIEKLNKFYKTAKRKKIKKKNRKKSGRKSVEKTATNKKLY